MINQQEQDEEYKFIEGYNNKYLISNHGKIISLQGKIPQEKKPGLVKRGYHQVQLSKPDKSLKGELVLRIVAKHFLENFVDNLQIDHIDDCKTNNNVQNLRMVTNSQNQMKKPKRSVQSTSKYIGVCFMKDRLKNQWHSQITIDGKVFHLGFFSSEKEAARKYNLEKQKRGPFSKINIISDSEESENDEKDKKIQQLEQKIQGLLDQFDQLDVNQ